MTSVERILQYTKLEQEAPDHTSLKPPQDWPSGGQVNINHLCISYSTDHMVLNDINVQFNSREKVPTICFIYKVI